MARVPSDDHLLELSDGRTIGYASVHRPRNAGIAFGDRYAGLDDPEWVRRRVVDAWRFFEQAGKQGAGGPGHRGCPGRRPCVLLFLDSFRASYSMHPSA
jgi:hypothetical protein